MTVFVEERAGEGGQSECDERLSSISKSALLRFVQSRSDVQSVAAAAVRFIDYRLSDPPGYPGYSASASRVSRPCGIEPPESHVRRIITEQIICVVCLKSSKSSSQTKSTE